MPETSCADHGAGRRRNSGAPARRRPLLLAWAWTVLLVLAVAGHLVVLYLPGQNVPQAGFEIAGLDKLIHVVAFGAPTLAAVVLGRSSGWALPFLVHAPVSEWVQARFAAERSGDLWDMVADLVGVALAVAAAALLWRWQGRGLEPRAVQEYASRVPSSEGRSTGL